MLTKKSTTTTREGKGRSGQALVIIVIAIIGLIGMTGLAVDGGRAFVDRQGAQSGADSAALAAALAKVNKPLATVDDLEKAAKAIATTNGYDPDTVIVLPITTTTSSLTATFTGCNGTTNSYTDTNTPNTKSTYIQVKIETQLDTSFAKLIGINQMGNCVDAVARAKPTTVIPLFDGNAIVGLNPSASNCAFDSGNSNVAEWHLTGGGIFSNGCAYSKNNDSVTLNTSGTCVTSVAGASGFTCMQTNQTAKAYDYPADIAAIMPPNPCTGNITNGRYENGNGGVYVPDDSTQLTFVNDIFCIGNFDRFFKKSVSLTNATLYVTDTAFDTKCNGSGCEGFSGTGTTTAGSVYKGYYMIVALLSKTAADDCDQNMDYRGNGTSNVTGTILAPSACIDFRGNSNGKTINSQLIGYELTSNGVASLDINYAEPDNAARPVKAVIELTK